MKFLAFVWHKAVHTNCSISLNIASNITVTPTIQFQLEMGELVSKVANVIMEYMWDKGLQSPFAHGKPGSDWWVGFMRRWLKLCERKPQHFAAN